MTIYYGYKLFILLFIKKLILLSFFYTQILTALALNAFY